MIQSDWRPCIVVQRANCIVTKASLVPYVLSLKRNAGEWGNACVIVRILQIGFGVKLCNVSVVLIVMRYIRFLLFHVWR